jgi:hypothetical protein
MCGKPMVFRIAWKRRIALRASPGVPMVVVNTKSVSCQWERFQAVADDRV